MLNPTPRKVLVLSVPGSGTRFLCQTILEGCFGYRNLHKAFERAAQDVQGYSQHHFQVRGPQPTVPPDTLVVVPLRYPVRSFFSRYHAEGETPTAHAARWQALFECYEACQPLLVCIAALNEYALRRAMLEALHGYLGRPQVDARRTVETLAHWKPVGASPHIPELDEYLRTGRVPGLDLSPLAPAIRRYEEGLWNVIP